MIAAATFCGGRIIILPPFHATERRMPFQKSAEHHPGFVTPKLTIWIFLVVVCFSGNVIEAKDRRVKFHANRGCFSQPTACMANGQIGNPHCTSTPDKSRYECCPQPTRICPVEPRIVTRQIGTSVLNAPITAHFFGSVGEKTLIFAAIHGDEPTTAAVANRLVEHLRQSPSLFEGRQVTIVPIANPDGLARRTRINAREIDLNRNFPAKNFVVGKRGRFFGGDEPASEPETQALIELIESWVPDRIVSLHAISRGRHGNNFDGPAERLAQLLSQHNHYPVLPSIGYPTPGSFGSWSGVDRRIPTITLEFPSDAPNTECWEENRDALLALIQTDQQTTSQ